MNDSCQDGRIRRQGKAGDGMIGRRRPVGSQKGGRACGQSCCRWFYVDVINRKHFGRGCDEKRVLYGDVSDFG